MVRVLRVLIRSYQIVLSPVVGWIGGSASGCRFQPTCSQYCLEALETHGLARGIWLSLKRLGRCHPWGGCGRDPVPPRAGEPNTIAQAVCE